MAAKLAVLLLLAAAAVAPAAAAAAAANSTGEGFGGTVAFQGSALLITYYSGVSQALLERGVVVPGKTRLAGLSGGGFTSASLALGKTGAQMRELWKAIIKSCATNPAFGGSCVGRFNGMMPEMLFKYLPKDAYKRVSGNVSIALSQFDGASNSLANSASWLIDSFDDQASGGPHECGASADLVAALTSTDYIPCWTGLTLYTIFRNNPVGDGGFANGFNELCSKSKGGKCLKVSSYFVGPRANHTCDPARCPLSAQSKCGDAERSDTITKLYENDPMVERQALFRLIHRCPLKDWPGQAPNPLPAFVPHNQTMPDIHPGVFNPLPVWDGKPLLACQWHEWAFNPPKGRELEAMDVMYDLGYRDGLAWANTHGFGKKAAAGAGAKAPAPTKQARTPAQAAGSRGGR